MFTKTTSGKKQFQKQFVANFFRGFDEIVVDFA
jgi:hypothetical protein